MCERKEYRKLCKAALAYKDGYIREQQFKNIASEYFKTYIYRNIIEYNKKLVLS